jgi:hypothetical protein
VSGRWGDRVTRETTGQSKAASTASRLALAAGAAAFGAIAIGAVAIGRLLVGHLVVKKARFGVLEVDELTVRKLRVVETSGTDPVVPPKVSAEREPTVQQSAIRSNDGEGRG